MPESGSGVPGGCEARGCEVGPGVCQRPLDIEYHTSDDGDFGVARFNVNVTGAPLKGREDDGFNEANDRADGGVAGESIE